MDKTGKLLIPAQFDFAYPFSEGLAFVKVGKKYGFIDKTGKMVIHPMFDYPDGNEEDCGFFSEGLACVKFKGKIGYINTKGEFVVPPRFDKAEKFTDGLAMVGFTRFPADVVDRLDYIDRWAYINKEGKYVWGSTK